MTRPAPSPLTKRVRLSISLRRLEAVRFLAATRRTEGSVHAEAKHTGIKGICHGFPYPVAVNRMRAAEWLFNISNVRHARN
jgi:hypothetical protein